MTTKEKKSTGRVDRRSARRRSLASQVMLGLGLACLISFGFFWALALPRATGQARGPLLAETRTEVSGSERSAPAEGAISPGAKVFADRVEAASVPAPGSAVVTGPTRVALYLEQAGQPIFVLPEVLELLESLELALQGGATDAVAALSARLARRIDEDPQAQEFLFDVIRIWPWEPGGSGFYVLMVRLLQNVKDAESRALFAQLLQQKEAEIFAARLQDPEEITSILLAEPDPLVRLKALQLLTEMELLQGEVRRSVEELAGGPDPRLRAEALAALLRLPRDQRDDVFLLDRMGQETDPEVRRALVRVLADSRSEAVARALVDTLEGSVDLVEKKFAAKGLGRQETSSMVVTSLLGALERETDRQLKSNLMSSAGRHVSHPDVAAYLERVLRSSEIPDLRAQAAGQIWRSSEDSVEALLRWTAKNDPVAAVRKKAERALRFRSRSTKRTG